AVVALNADPCDAEADMSEFTNQLKARADLGALIGEFVALKPGGNGSIGLCPFHGEKTPSFHVHRARQFYYCFGCHAHGDIFQFLMAMKKISFAEAVEQVAERLGVEMPRASGGAAEPERRDLLQIHQVAQTFFERRLAAAEGAGARAYLAERELAAETAARFGLGYAPENGRALTGHLQAAGFAPGLALRSGLCQARRESAERGGREAPVAEAEWADLYDRFRERLTFPIGDERGRVIAFGGRALVADASGKSPKYVNSPESPLYTKGRVVYNLDRAREAIRRLDYVILVEGYFDCIRVFNAGFENVVATCGTALTPAQVAQVGRLSKKAVLNFDPDAAGAAAAERSIGLLLEESFRMRVVALEGGLDPDLYIRRRGRERYAEALRSSRSFFDYLADRARQQFDLRRAEGKVAAVNHLLPFLSQVHEPILRQELAENLAAELGIAQPVLSQQLLGAARQRRSQLPPPAQPAPELVYAERVWLRAWVEWEDRRPELAGAVREKHLLEGLATEALAEALMQRPEAGGGWEGLTAGLEEADRRLLAAVVMAPGEAPLTPAGVEGAMTALEERRGERQARGLQARIQQAAAAGDRAELEVLLRQKAAWDSQRAGSRGATGQAAGAGR
ncbi:MAG: DNA primase, partial [Terriglobales bacterium]